MKSAVSQCDAALCVITAAILLLNINCCVPIKKDTRDENNSWWIPHTTLHTQLWCSVESSHYRSIPSPYVSCLILSTLTKTCNTNSFMWKKKKKSISLQSFSLSKCQASQYVRRAPGGHWDRQAHSNLRTENFAGHFSICHSWWSTGINEAYLERIFVVLMYFKTIILYLCYICVE